MLRLRTFAAGLLSTDLSSDVTANLLPADTSLTGRDTPSSGQPDWYFAQMAGAGIEPALRGL